MSHWLFPKWMHAFRYRNPSCPNCSTDQMMVALSLSVVPGLTSHRPTHCCFRLVWGYSETQRELKEVLNDGVKPTRCNKSWKSCHVVVIRNTTQSPLTLFHKLMSQKRLLQPVKTTNEPRNHADSIAVSATCVRFNLTLTRVSLRWNKSMAPPIEVKAAIAEFLRCSP